MTIETQLRNNLDQRAAHVDLGGLAPMGDIAAAGRRRTTRNRIVTGAGALILVAALVGGFFTNRSDETGGPTIATPVDDPALRAEIEAALVAPHQVHAFRERFVGLTKISDGEATLGRVPGAAPDGLARTAVAPISSADGSNWSLDPLSPLLDDANARMIIDNGEVIVAGIEGDNVVALRSFDYVEWTRYEAPLPDRMGDPAALALGQVTVSGDRVELVVFAFPGSPSALFGPPNSLRAAGITAGELCHLDTGFGDETGTYRLCGSEETILLPPDEDTSDDVGAYGLVLDKDTLSVSARGDGQPFLASLLFGDLTLSDGEGQLEIVDDVLHSSPAGAPAHRLALGELFRELPSADPIVDQVFEGPTGWAFVARRWTDIRTPPTVDRFELSFNELNMSGEPGGLVTLTDSNGAELRRWDQFETANLPWNDIDVQPDGLAIHDGDGNQIGVIPHQTWADALAPDRDLHASQVWFSPDGIEWRRLATSDAELQIVSLGAESIVVRSWGPANLYRPENRLGLMTDTFVDGAIPIGAGDRTVRAVPESAFVDTSSESRSYTPIDPLVDAPTQPSGLPSASDADLMLELIEVNDGSEFDEVVAKHSDQTPDAFDIVVRRTASDEPTFVVTSSQLVDGIERSLEFRYERRQDGELVSTGGGDFGFYLPYATLADEPVTAQRISGAPPQAAWVVIETASGTTVATDVTGGAGYVEWPRELGDPVLYSLQDAEGNELWWGDDHVPD